METVELKAHIRRESGKGPARRFREKGLIPSVFYGPGAESILLTVNYSDLTRLSGTEYIKLMIEDDGGKFEKLSVVKELQIEPVSRNPLHADFYEIRMDHKLVMDIPIHLTGQSTGMEAGGILQFSKRYLKASGLPSLLPDTIEIDISKLDIGDSVKVEDVTLGEGIEILDPPTVRIVAVAVARAVQEIEEEEVGELPGEKGEEQEKEDGEGK
jgi:ribosomal protein L25, Ctc-form